MKHHILLLSLLIGPTVALGANPPASKPAQAAEADFNAALFKEQAENDPEAAAALFQRAAQNAPERSALRGRAMAKQAACYEKLGRLDAAIEVIERFLAQPGDAPADLVIDSRNNLARWRAQRGPQPAVPVVPADASESGTLPTAPQRSPWITGLQMGVARLQSRPMQGFIQDQTVLSAYAGYEFRPGWDARLELSGWLPKTTSENLASPGSSETAASETSAYAFYGGPAVHYTWTLGPWRIRAGGGVGAVNSHQEVETRTTVTVSSGSTTMTTTHETSSLSSLAFPLQAGLAYSLTSHWGMEVLLRDVIIWRHSRAWHVLEPTFGFIYRF